MARAAGERASSASASARRAPSRSPASSAESSASTSASSFSSTSVLSLVVEQIAERCLQRRTRAMQPRAHGADVDADGDCDLVVRQLAELAQHEDLALLGRQRPERVLEAAAVAA